MYLLIIGFSKMLCSWYCRQQALCRSNIFSGRVAFIIVHCTLIQKISPRIQRIILQSNNGKFSKKIKNFYNSVWSGVHLFIGQLSYFLVWNPNYTPLKIEFLWKNINQDLIQDKRLAWTFLHINSYTPWSFTFVIFWVAID